MVVESHKVHTYICTLCVHVCIHKFCSLAYLTRLFICGGKTATANKNGKSYLAMPDYMYLCTYMHTCTLCLQAAQLSKKEIEDLLKKGAYGAVMEGDDDANQ